MYYNIIYLAILHNIFAIILYLIANIIDFIAICIYYIHQFTYILDVL